MTKAIAYIDSTRMVRALSAGIRHLFQRREYIDRINVFPVPDGDTGTNMAFSFKVIHEAVHNRHGLSMKELMKRVADASLDGSRGNSGAIMAQYFHGFSESMGSKAYITASELAAASCAGAKAAWTAMSEPVAGTLPPEVEQKVRDVHGVKSASVELVWDPPWDQEKMSEAAKVTLGFF